MSTHAYSEDQLVEQPAIGLFAALGWQTVSAQEESFGAPPSPPAPLPLAGEGGTWLGRETKGEVVLVDRLRAAGLRVVADLPGAAGQSGAGLGCTQALVERDGRWVLVPGPV